MRAPMKRAWATLRRGEGAVRTRSRRLVALAFALASSGGALGACFTPREPPCAFSCVSAGARCPADYTCGTDGVCHRDGAEGACSFTLPDAGAGGSTADGAAGGGADGGAGSMD